MKQKFNLVVEFLENHPDYFSGKVDITTQEGKNALWLSFTETRNKPIVLQEPATIPDPAVSEILRAAMGYTDEQLEHIKYTHRLSMAAENKVGELLEMYLAEKLEPFGWVWCSGNFVRAIDFIKKGLDGNWYCLQIKNRNNTENSSSSRVRIGTEIEKWFRTFSTYSVRRGTYTNWENFPDISVREVLSEKDFLDFVNRKIKG